MGERGRRRGRGGTEGEFTCALSPNYQAGESGPEVVSLSQWIRSSVTCPPPLPTPPFPPFAYLSSLSFLLFFFPYFRFSLSVFFPSIFLFFSFLVFINFSIFISIFIFNLFLHSSIYQLFFISLFFSLFIKRNNKYPSFL